MENWGKILVLSLGGVAGVNARYWLGVWINRWASSQFPWATFSINVSGAFAIGFLTALLARWSPHSHLRLLILVGFLGGYTTFSTFAFESVTLWQRGERVFSLATRRMGFQCGLHSRKRSGRLRGRGSGRGSGARNCSAHLESVASNGTIHTGRVDRGIGAKSGRGSAACPWSRSIPDVGGQPRRDGRSNQRVARR